MAKYLWDNPHEWLDHAVACGTVTHDELLAMIHDNVDSDDVQTTFQPQMIADGYFVPIADVVCAECEEAIDTEDPQADQGIQCEICNNLYHVWCIAEHMIECRRRPQ